MSGYRDTTVMNIGKIEVVETTFDDAPEYNRTLQTIDNKKARSTAGNI